MLEAISSSLYIDPQTMQQATQAKSSLSSDKYEEAGKEFEAVLWRQFLEPALKPMFEGALKEGGACNDIQRSFFVNALANNMAEQNPLGFSSLLQLHASRAHLSHSNPLQETISNGYQEEPL